MGSDEDHSPFDSSVHQVKPSCSSSKYSGNKENMSMDKAEIPVLSMEPVSMKRKKKGGGYNLRKSLAWDRAFLTEEGILDPVELSVISGTSISFGGQPLSVISEVGSSFKCGDSQNIISSSSSRSHQRKQASRTMLTSHCVSGSGAKSSGCPRPSPSSSLKRPAFVNTSRSSGNELKFSKTAIPKPSMCSIPRSAKSSLPVGSQLQQNQFVQSAANNQTCTSSSKIPTIKNIPQVKAGSMASPSTSSSKSLKEDLTQATTTFSLHPSTKICQPPVSKVSNTFVKKTPREMDAFGISRTKGDGSVVNAPIPQRTTAGKNMHHPQFQAKKPSGLRMPSPSLGFFGQPKDSVSNQPTLMSIKPNIPGLYNIHDHRRTKELNDMKLRLSTMPSSSKTEDSALSDSDGVSSETSEPVLEKNTNKFVHDDVACDELQMHGADANDTLNKVYCQKQNVKQIVFNGAGACETSESVLKQNLNKLEHAEISYDELPVHEENAVDLSDKVHTQHDTIERVIRKGDIEHKINDTGLLPKPEDGESLLEADDMKKRIQGFQDSRSNDSNSTCSPLTEGETISNSAVISPSLTCELTLPAEDLAPDKKSSTENHHELPMENCYQSLDQSDVTSATNELTLPAEDLVPDKKSSPGNHHELPMESCHQSLDQSDAPNDSAPEVPDYEKSCASEVPEDKTCRCVEVLVISGEMKCQTPESCDSELGSSCFLSRGKDKDCSPDADSRSEVDDETYFGVGQSHASNGMYPKNYLDVKAVATDLIEYPEKNLVRERNNIAVEESSHCNLELCVTGDLWPDRDPRQEKVVEVPPSTSIEKCNEQCETTSCTNHFSLRGQMARENSRSHQENFDGLKNNLSEDEDNADILYKMDTSTLEELTHNSGSISIETIKNSKKDLNKNGVQIILPKDLVPFSEEWLAAIEAAGEDVLTLKTGAVQNSPTDKSLPEPSPWSPVKRKTNQLGPFDCTKYTNPVSSDSHH